MFKFEPVGHVLHQRLHEHLVPAARRRGSCSSTPRSALGVKAGGTTADGMFTLEDVECIAACTEAPALQVNYRYRYKVTHADFDQLIDDLRAGRLADEIPPHGTLARVRQQHRPTAGPAPASPRRRRSDAR